VHIVNAEDEPIQFAFVDSSCHAAGYLVNVKVEPMHGTAPANSRFYRTGSKYYSYVMFAISQKRLLLTRK